MKISIIYVSQTGNTEMAAEYIQDGILAKNMTIGELAEASGTSVATIFRLCKKK